MYNLPGFKQLIELLNFVLVHIEHFLASLGLGPNWTWGLAIIGLTIIVRLILFPLTWKQFSSAQAMQAVQPKLKELQKKYKGDRAKLQAETMKLYQEHRVNPFASCLPIILQLPVFISLYYAIKGTSYLDPANTKALAEASFLWIPHLGLPDPTYIMLILYVATQLISTELMLTQQTDKSQKMIMRAMPIFFVFILYRFPAGLFVYWVTTNIWTIGQQLIIKKVMKPKVLEPVPVGEQKRSRFMEAVSKAQDDRTKTRDDLLAKRKAKAAELAAAGDKRAAPASGGQKKGARKPPPGKGKKKAPPPASGTNTNKNEPAGG
ncbi:MAG TPA: YidC/Oxa1 family membrane protein insertase [Thermoleophilia bacterium]|nr:YidC/Oxa1 family membrane protein insertase [Thermoleophilia bacterium]